MSLITNIEALLEEEGIIFLAYGGLFTQALIAGMTEALEQKSEEAAIPVGISNKLFVIFIELSQNLMHYTKQKVFDPLNLIYVLKHSNHYSICSQNSITKEEKEILEPKLLPLQDASKDEIKQLYKVARKNGRNTHEKGGGLGFLEIAKKADELEYVFEPKKDGTYHFKLCAKLKI